LRTREFVSIHDFFVIFLLQSYECFFSLLKWVFYFSEIRVCKVTDCSQYRDNDRLSNNDVKFRYIKALGEASPETMLQLESIFEYEPDKQKQRTLRQRVEQHERATTERTRALEEANLKAAQAEQLRQPRK
jgi:hypothetical protein